MLPGVFRAAKKDGSIYYRSNITYRGKHISLGSFDSQLYAHYAYLEAGRLLQDARITIDNAVFSSFLLHHEKVVSLLNFRDNRIYIKNPVYMYRSLPMKSISLTSMTCFIFPATSCSNGADGCMSMTTACR